MPDLKDGETAEIKGSARDPYILKNTGGVYSCTCPAWRNQSLGIEKRTCKHLRKLRGDAAEEARIGGAVPVRKAAKADGEERTFSPIIREEVEPMTATEVLSAVSELLRALRLGPMELALWYRRRPDEDKADKGAQP